MKKAKTIELTGELTDAEMMERDEIEGAAAWLALKAMVDLTDMEIWYGIRRPTSWDDQVADCEDDVHMAMNGVDLDVVARLKRIWKLLSTWDKYENHRFQRTCKEFRDFYNYWFN